MFAQFYWLSAVCLPVSKFDTCYYTTKQKEAKPKVCIDLKIYIYIILSFYTSLFVTSHFLRAVLTSSVMFRWLSCLKLLQNIFKDVFSSCPQVLFLLVLSFLCVYTVCARLKLCSLKSKVCFFCFSLNSSQKCLALASLSESSKSTV